MEKIMLGMTMMAIVPTLTPPAKETAMTMAENATSSYC